MNFAVAIFFASGLIAPPPEFDHPFQGQLVEHAWPVSERPFGVWSKAVRNYMLDGFTGHPRCEIWIAPEQRAAVQADLRRIETANCNGWAARDGDVNDRRQR